MIVFKKYRCTNLYQIGEFWRQAKNTIKKVLKFTIFLKFQNKGTWKEVQTYEQTDLVYFYLDKTNSAVAATYMNL